MSDISTTINSTERSDQAATFDIASYYNALFILVSQMTPEEYDKRFPWSKFGPGIIPTSAARAQLVIDEIMFGPEDPEDDE